jgi:CxxC motif-containing protein (DUF1111 family)
LAASSASVVVGQFAVHDPGVRGGTIDAGKALGSVATTTGLTDFFNSGLGQFAEEQTVQGDNNGLGPRFNSNACGSCHSQPAVGGTSPSLTAFPFVGQNPQVQFADRHNTLPSFITPDGPAREARFKFFLNRNGSLSDTPDGGVHDLFVISGRSDAGTCAIKQPNFAHNLALNNVIFRIPTPVFGAGLIENVADETILTNMRSDDGIKDALGITGHPNRNGNDGTITRFGWKAQNKSALLFAGEAYNVEMGITNELFPNERGFGGVPPPAACLGNLQPEDETNFLPISSTTDTSNVPSDVEDFSIFMRFLDQPTPSCTTSGPAPTCSPSIQDGLAQFKATGCALCHTPSMMTDASDFTPGLSHVQANLFSDLLLHHMGENLNDGITQGAAGPDQFRTAPLWGIGQRLFFLHDGRTSDLLAAIKAHASRGSEANAVIQNFNRLTETQQQDLLNFLRSL